MQHPHSHLVFLEYFSKSPKLSMGETTCTVDGGEKRKMASKQARRKEKLPKYGAPTAQAGDGERTLQNRSQPNHLSRCLEAADIKRHYCRDL